MTEELPKTHFLDFKANDKEFVRISVDEKKRNEMIGFMIGKKVGESFIPPTYDEKKRVIVWDKKTDRTFTMADFTGRSGKHVKHKRYIPSLPEPPMSEGEKERRKIRREKMEDEMAAKGSLVFKTIVANRKK